MRVRRTAGFGALLGALYACGVSEPSLDAAAPAPDAGPWYPGDLPVLSWGATIDPADPTRIDPLGAMPADLSCLGSRAAPPVLAPQPTEVFVYDNATGMPVPGLCVRGFPLDVLPDVDCGTGGAMTDASGRTTVSFEPGGWGALEIFPRDDPDPTRAYIRTLTVFATELRAMAVSRSTLNIGPTLLGRSLRPGTALLVNRVFDCAGHVLYGAVLRIAASDGTYVEPGPGRTDPAILYTNGRSLPSRDQRWSHIDGSLGAINLPIPSDGSPVLVEVWGRLAPEAAPAVLSCERAYLLADGATVLWGTEPLRSDGPSCPGLGTAP